MSFGERLKSARKDRGMTLRELGEAITAEDNIVDYQARIADDLPKGELFYLRAKGDSMSPDIKSGALVLCRQQPDVENGEIAAVLVNGNTEATLKKVRNFSVRQNSAGFLLKGSKKSPIRLRTGR